MGKILDIITAPIGWFSAGVDRLMAPLHEKWENEKIIGDTPFVEKPIPEYPIWMKQPVKKEDLHHGEA